MNSWFLLVNILYLIFCSLNLFGVSRSLIPFYAAYSTVAFLFDMLLIFAPSFMSRHTLVSVYLTLVSLLSYGTIASLLEPYMPATMYLVLLTLSALSFIDKFYRMIALLVTSAFCFLLLSFTFKTFSIAYHDAYNSLIVLLLSIGLHYTFQRTRVQQFILYQKDLHVQHELEVKSSFDVLTYLFNRGKFFSIAEEVLRLKDEDYMALCLIDLDKFKEINDTLGHQMGDKVIQVTGKALLDFVSPDTGEIWSLPERVIANKLSFAGRLGGDEFILFIRGKYTREEVYKNLERLLHTLNAVKFDEFTGIQASFGVTELSPFDSDIDDAYTRADKALYRSKRAGKNQIHFSDDEGDVPCIS